MNNNPYGGSPYVTDNLFRTTAATDHLQDTTTNQGHTINQEEDTTTTPTNNNHMALATTTTGSRDMPTITTTKVLLTAAPVWELYAAHAACLIVVCGDDRLILLTDILIGFSKRKSTVWYNI